MTALRYALAAVVFLWTLTSRPAAVGLVLALTAAWAVVRLLKRRVPRARMAGDSDRHAHHSGRSAAGPPAPAGGLAALGTGG